MSLFCLLQINIIILCKVMKEINSLRTSDRRDSHVRSVRYIYFIYTRLLSYKVVELNRLVTSCSNNLLSSSNSTICQQVVSDNLVATWWNNNIVTTCWQACYKPVANTSCWQVVSDNLVTTLQNNSIVTTCWQACYKPVANTSWWLRFFTSWDFYIVNQSI
jgi:hypothetical protein